jgi:hypothetical protein
MRKDTWNKHVHKHRAGAAIKYQTKLTLRGKGATRYKVGTLEMIKG